MRVWLKLKSTEKEDQIIEPGYYLVEIDWISVTQNRRGEDMLLIEGVTVQSHKEEPKD